MRSECYGLLSGCFIHGRYIKKYLQSVYLLDWISCLFYPYFFLFTHIQKVISFCFDADYYVGVYGNYVYDQDKLSKRYITLFMIETR